MKRLMDRIGETVKGRIAEAKLSPVEDEIRKYILREFASNGRPPTSGEIMKGLGLSSVNIVYQTMGKLEKADILSRKGGEIVSAYPFSAAETHHKVIFEDGHEVYALCATDALGIHFMLDKDITIISKCPRCEKEMRIVVKDGQIDSYDPEGIIEFVSNRERGGCTAETLCPFINFFCSKQHLKEWSEKNPEYRKGEIYSLSDVLEHGKTIFGDFLK
ncbi:MAG: organomercurial lyase [Dehalococcoidia bacterium]